MKRWLKISLFLALVVSLQPIYAQYNEPWAPQGKETADCRHMTTLYTWLETAPGMHIGLPKGGSVYFGRREIEQILPMLKATKERACKKQEKEKDGSNND